MNVTPMELTLTNITAFSLRQVSEALCNLTEISYLEETVFTLQLAICFVSRFRKLQKSAGQESQGGCRQTRLDIPE